MGIFGKTMILFLTTVGCTTALSLAGQGDAVPVVLLVGAIAGSYLRIDNTPRPTGYKPLLLGLVDALVVSIVVLPVFFAIVYLISKTGLYSWKPGFPPEFHKLILIQLLVVALPEEIFFRAIIQKGFDRHFGMKWKLFGVPYGWSLFLTSALFGLAHVPRQGPAGLSTMFPALLFGLLYEKRQSVAGPILFHALCNLAMYCLVSFR